MHSTFQDRYKNFLDDRNSFNHHPTTKSGVKTHERELLASGWETQMHFLSTFVDKKIIPCTRQCSSQTFRVPLQRYQHSNRTHLSSWMTHRRSETTEVALGKSSNDDRRSAVSDERTWRRASVTKRSEGRCSLSRSPKMTRTAHAARGPGGGEVGGDLKYCIFRGAFYQFLRLFPVVETSKKQCK